MTHPRPPYAQIRAAAHAGRIDYRPHARDRMQERGFTPGDVRHVLAESSNAWPDGPPASKWRVLGRDLDGQRRMVVVALVGLRLTVITVVDADGTDDA